MNEKILNYIERLEISTNNYTNIMSIYKLLGLIETNKQEETLDVLDQLIKNPKVNDILRKVYQYELKSNRRDKFLEAIENTDLFISLMEMYADSIGENLYENFDSNQINDLEDSTKKYLNEISRYSVLPKEIEYALSIVATEDSSFEERQEAKNVLGSFPEKLLVFDAKNEKEEINNARIDLVNHNLKFVVFLSKKFVNKGMDLLDIIQTGNMGLMKASKKFDPKKGYKFSTYASWWIKQSIYQDLYNSANLIRRPVHFEQKIVEYQRAYAILSSKLNRSPSSQEILDELGPKWGNKETLVLVIQYLSELVSLSQPIGEDEETTLEDFIEDKNSLSVEEIIEKELLEESVNNLLENAMKYGGLSEVQVLILKQNNGFLGKPISLKKIAGSLGITLPKVQRYEKDALRKLKKYIIGNIDVCFMQNEGRNIEGKHTNESGIVSRNNSSLNEEEKQYVLSKISSMFDINYRG